MLLSIVAVAVIMSGIVLNAYSAGSEEENCTGSSEWINGRMKMARTNGWSHGGPRGRGGLRGRGCCGFIEVSEEFEENVIDIATSDQDVQDLLDEGYNITRVRPIIKTVVEGDCDVVTKATGAIVMLEKDETSHAVVWVDLEEAKVTEIVILTRTVIEKP